MEGAVNFSAADMAVVLYGVQKYPKIPKNTARPVHKQACCKISVPLFSFLLFHRFHTPYHKPIPAQCRLLLCEKGNICPAAFIHSTDSRIDHPVKNIHDKNKQKITTNVCTKSKSPQPEGLLFRPN